MVSYGQQGESRQEKDLHEKIKLTISSAPLTRVLEEIDRQTSYSFSYIKEDLEKIIVRDYMADNISLEKALKLLQKKVNIEFTISNRSIIFRLTAPDTTASPSRQPALPGKLSGKIVDEADGEPVAGATVRIGERGAITDIDGSFHLYLPRGVYAAEVSFVGYGVKKITDIEVKGQTTTLNLTLKREKGSLAGVTVSASAKKEGVAALYARQKNAAGITDGISAEQIARTPDKTVAESLKRISGVAVMDNKYVVIRGLSERYNGSMLNGQLMPSTELNRKQFSFDIIPSNMVDNITIAKSLTPDMSAEFGGGLVMVNTKAIPSENFFTVIAGGSVNDKTTGKSFLTQKIEGREYFGLTARSRELFGTLDWKSRNDIVNNGKFTLVPGGGGTLNDPSDLANNWKLYRYKPGISPNFQVSLGRVIPLEHQRKIGILVSVSYRNAFQTQDIRSSRNGFGGGDRAEELYGFIGKSYGLTSNVGGVAAIGFTSPKSKLTLQTIWLQALDRQLILGKGRDSTISDLGHTMGYYDFTRQTTLWQNQLKGEQVFGKKGIKLDWGGTYTRLDRQKPDNHYMEFDPINQGNDKPGQTSDFSISNTASDFSELGVLRTWSRAFEDNYAWNMDISLPFRLHIGKLPINSVFKTGYSGWSKHRRFWVLNTGVAAYNHNPAPISEYFDPAIRDISAGISRFGDDYNKTAALHAVYGMLDNRIGQRIRLVWGLREEFLNLNQVNGIVDRLINTQLNNGDKTDYSDLTKREPNHDLFPSASLTYSLTSKMNLRLAYAKSIVRPDLRDLSLFQEYDYELGGIYSSNRPIVSTRIRHFDFRYEWYPAAGEVISFSLFYKNLDYPMEIYKDASNKIYQLHNDKSAINKGLEIELRKSFGFTGAPVLKHLTVYANFTRLFSTVTPMEINYIYRPVGDHNKQYIVEVMGAKQNRPQQGASNYMGNAGLYYDTRPLSLTLSYNYVSNRAYRAAEMYPEGLFERPLNALDGQIAVRVLKQKGEIKLNVGNIFNNFSIIYKNTYGKSNGGFNPLPPGGRAPTTKELLYQKGQDFINYQASPGRTFSFNFTYTF